MNANAESDAASASPPAPAEPLTPAEMARQIAWWKAEAEHYRDVAIGLMEAAGGSCAVLVFGQTDVRLFAPTPDREISEPKAEPPR